MKKQAKQVKQVKQVKQAKQAKSGVPGLIAGTLVAVPDGKLKAIEDVRKGNLVLTHAGPRPVTGLFKHKKKQAKQVKPDVNARDSRGWPALHWAVKAGRLSEVQRLIQAGADVNAKLPSSGTPLHMAVKEGLIEIILELRKAGADPNIKDSDGNRPSDYTDSFKVKDALNGVLADQTLSLEGKCTAALVEASASLFTAITKLRQARDYADAVESLIILPLTEQAKEVFQKVEALIAARRSNH